MPNEIIPGCAQRASFRVWAGHGHMGGRQAPDRHTPITKSRSGHCKHPRFSSRVLKFDQRVPLQVLFFKAHIFAGQAKPNGKSAKDFAWLTTEEIKAKVAPEYWASIRDMLSEK